MRKINLILLAGICLSASYAQGAFRDPGYGARPLGMGGAYVAMSGDLNSLVYNPAGIAAAETPQAGFVYAKLFNGLDGVDLGVQNAAVVYPSPVGAFGAAWSRTASADVYSEDSFSLTYASNIKHIIERLAGRRRGPDLAGGVTVKYLSHGYTLDSLTRNDPVFAAGTSKSAVTFDIGLWTRPFPEAMQGLTAGAAVRNLTQPDVGLLSPDIVPREMSLGAAYAVDELLRCQDVTFNAQVTQRSQEWGDDGEKFVVALGGEGWLLKKQLGVRAGVNTKEIALGASYRANIRKLAVEVDGAYLFPLQLTDSSGSYRMSVVFGF